MYSSTWDRGEDVLAQNPFGEYDGVLEVVSFPGHERYLEVTAEGKFSALSGVSFGKYLSGLHSLSLLYDGLEVDGCALVGLAVQGQTVDCYVGSEAYEFLGLGPVVLDMNLACVHVYYFALSLGYDLCA